MSAPAKHRILVVEDNRDISDLLVIRLELSGYVTCVAHTRDQGVSEAFAFKPDAILLDIGLPDGDGFELLRVLKTNAKTCGIPVLMLTARQGMADVRRALDLGAKDYVTKPFDDRRLMQRVARLMGLTVPARPREKTILL